MHRRILFLWTALAVSAVLLACSSDSSSSGSSSDPASSCTSMCAKAGFASSRVDVQPNEINCFCTGTGTMTAAICTEGCTGLGKSKSQPFGSAAGKMDACQCE